MLSAQQQLQQQIAALQAQQATLQQRATAQLQRATARAQLYSGATGLGGHRRAAMASYILAQRQAAVGPATTAQGSAGQQSSGSTPATGWAAFVANMPLVAGQQYTVTQALAAANVVQTKGSKRIGCRAAMLASPRFVATQVGGPRSAYVFTAQ